MDDSPRYIVAEDLLVQEIESLQRRLDQAQGELDEMRGKQPRKKIERVRLTHAANGALSCAEAIDEVLRRSKKPISAREIEVGFKSHKLNVQGNPSISSIRTALHRRADDLGWKRSGRGKRIRWRRVHKEEA